MTEGMLPRSEEELRATAVKRLKAKREFKGHLLAYVTVNALLVGIWYLTSAGFFWPMFVMGGWGVGVAMHAWDTYAPEATPDQVAEEMERLRGHRIQR